MLEADFTIKGPSLNYHQIELFLSEVLADSPTSKDWRVLDFRPASYFGLYETLLLLIGLKTAAQRRAIPNWLMLPDNTGFLRFCTRWQLIKELKKPTDYCARGLICGYDGLPAERLVSLEEKKQEEDEAAWLESNPGGIRFASSRLVKLERVTTLEDTFDYTRFLHAPPVLNTLMKQLGIRNSARAQEFADCIIWELLRNIVHHVWLYEQGLDSTGGEFAGKAVPSAGNAVGFIAMQTHDEGMKNWDHFLEKWHPVLHPTLELYKDRGGFVEVAVADSGSGITETLLPTFMQEHGAEPTTTLEILQYACQLGTTRYGTTDKTVKDKEIQLLLDGFAEMEKKVNKKATKWTPVSRTRLDDYLDQLHNGTLGTGTGMSLMADTVKLFGGTLLVRSKDTVFCPWLPSSQAPWHEIVPNHLPGVQIRVLVPKGV